MEATFCLGRHPLSIPLSSLPLPSKDSNLSAINHHGSIHHSSLLLKSSYLRSSHTRKLHPVICAFDRFQKPRSDNLSKTDNKPRSMVGVAAVLACVLGIIGCSSRKYHRAMAQPDPPQQAEAKGSNEAQDNTSNGTRPQFPPFDGRYALNSLLEVFQKSMASQVNGDIKVRTQPDLATIKEQAFFMLRYGMANEAVEMLKKRYDQAAKKHEELADALDMLLVEILICLGRYKEARERDCLKEGNGVKTDSPPEEEGMTDCRPQFYKAILYSMSDNDADRKEAKQFWNEFLDSLHFD